MVAALREMQENQRFSEIRIDKLEFVDYSGVPTSIKLPSKS